MAETAEPDPTRNALDPARAELLELLERLFGPGPQADDDGADRPPNSDDASIEAPELAGIAGIALLP